VTELEKRLAALEATVAELQDHRDICQLIASYGPLVDTAKNTQRADAVARLWAEDGVYDVGGIGSYAGRGAIAGSYEGFHFDLVRDGVCHIMGMPHVQLDGDKATALSYSTVFRPEGDRFYPWRVASNVWGLERRDGRWEVRNRVNRLMNGSEEAQQVLRRIDAAPEAARR
jgi:uncharacterized protein (TIGR02246 family)